MIWSFFRPGSNLPRASGLTAALELARQDYRRELGEKRRAGRGGRRPRWGLLEKTPRSTCSSYWRLALKKELFAIARECLLTMLEAVYWARRQTDGLNKKDPAG